VDYIKSYFGDARGAFINRNQFGEDLCPMLPIAVRLRFLIDRIPVESQRDSVSQPRVAACPLPWVDVHNTINPNGVASGYGRFLGMLRNPVGVENHNRICVPRVAAFAATLGFMTQPRWGKKNDFHL